MSESNSGVPFEHPWKEDDIGNIGSVTVGGTPKTAVPAYWNGDVPWMASGDVNLKRITDVPTRISNLGLRFSNATLVEPPAVAVGLAGQGKTRGTAALVLCKLCTNQSVALIRSEPEVVDSEYLFYNLEYRYEELRSRSAGGGRAGLSKRLLEAVPIPVPPLVQQSKIAEILSTVDRAIEQTENLIAKQQRIKTGLMQDLLTRGIDENGNLRSEATHEFIDSPLGRIPVEWEAESIDKLAIHLGSGVTPRGGESVYVTEGILFIRSQNVHFAGIVLSDIAFITPRIHASMKRSEVFENDVLLNITGASIGRCCRVPRLSVKANVNQHVCSIRLRDSTEHDAAFLASVIESDIGQRQILQFNAGGNREGLNYQQVRGFLIPWPKEPERKRVSETLRGLNESVNTLANRRDKLVKIKTALMQDLLTGKKRVTPLLETAATA